MDKILHSTIIVDPKPLDVGIKVETRAEPVGDKYFIYWRAVTWFSEMPDIQAVSGKTYLEGKLEGLEQTIKLELHEDVLMDIGKTWHELGELYVTEVKDVLKLQYFAAVAKKL